MIKLSAVYVLAGLLFAGFAAFSAFDQANTKRLGNTAFWGLVSMSFLAGDRLGDLGNGLVVLALSGLAGFGRLGRGHPATTSPEQRAASAQRYGNRLFAPALILPLVVGLGVLVLKPISLGGQPLMDPKQATLISLALAVIVAVAAALILLRQPLSCPLQEGRRLVDTIGWAVLLPQFLAALGAVFTMLMGNAFAAFPVLTGGIALPILVGHFGANPAAVASLGMLSGFCGTLMTPLAANFNLVPSALLEIPDRYAVIKAQIPTALLMLATNMVLMYVLAFPR